MNQQKRMKWTLELEDSFALTFPDERDLYQRNFSIDYLLDEEFLDFVSYLKKLN